VLLHRHRVVRAALDGGVVRDDDALATGHPTDAGDDPGGRGVVVVEAGGGQRREFEERAAGVEQGVDALARQQLVAGDVPFAGSLPTAERDGAQLLGKVGDERGVRGGVAGRRPGVRRLRADDGCVHGAKVNRCSPDVASPTPRRVIRGERALTIPA
jgi:hypothetical protein